MGVNFVLLKLMTGRMSVEAFGLYSLCLTIVLFVRQLIYDPMSMVIAKKCGSAHGSRSEVFEGILIARYSTDRLLLLFAILATAYWLVMPSVLSESVERGAIVCCALYLCANGAQGVYFNVLNVARYRKLASLFSICDSALKLGFMYVALYFVRNDLIGALFSLSVGSFIVFAFVRRYLGSYEFADSNTPRRLSVLVKHIFLATVPLYLPTLLAALKSVGDRWILAAYIGVDELAAYTILLQIGYSPMILLVGVIQTFIAPRVYMLSSNVSTESRSEMRRFFGVLLATLFVLTILGCGVAYFAAELIFDILVGGKYAVYAAYLPVFIAAGSLAAGSGIIQLGTIGLFDTVVVGRLMAASVVISVVTALVLIVSYGFRGAVSGLLISSMVTAILYGAVTYSGMTSPDNT